MAEPVKFQISSIRTELELDFARYSEEIRLALEACLKSGGTAIRLAEVIHAAHAIRGVSSLVGAWALAFWCEDMERLARAATQDLTADTPRASLVIRFLYDHREVMSKLGRLSLAEEFDNALTAYADIRSRMPLVVRELTSAKLESTPVRPPTGERNNFVPSGRKTNNLPLPPPARKESNNLPRASFARATPALTTQEERRPYLAEARFYLARVDGILRTEVMPAKTADLWTVLARLFSSLEFYCLSLGNARILELVDKAQQLTLRAVEDPAARTEGTRLALAEYHFILGGEFDAQESGQPELAPTAATAPVPLPPATRRAGAPKKNRNRVQLPDFLNLPPAPGDLRLVPGAGLPAEDIYALVPGHPPRARPQLEIVPKPAATESRQSAPPPLARPRISARRPPVVAQTSPLIALTRRRPSQDVDLDPAQLPSLTAKESPRVVVPKNKPRAKDLSTKETTPISIPAAPTPVAPETVAPTGDAAILDFPSPEPAPAPPIRPPILTTAPARAGKPVSKITKTVILPPVKSDLAYQTPRIHFAAKKTTQVMVPPPPPTGLRPVVDPAARETMPFQTPQFGSTHPAKAAPPESDPREDSGFPSESGDPELIEIFLPEARELLDDSESALLDWENSVAIEDRQRVLRRHLHTLKGAANSIGLTLLGGNVHLLEEFVTSRPAAEMPRRALDRLLKCVDEARTFIGILEDKGTAPWRADWANLAEILETAPEFIADIPPEEPQDLAVSEPEPSIETPPEPLVVEEAPVAQSIVAEPVMAEPAPLEEAVPLDDPEMRTIFLDELQTLLEDFDRGITEWTHGESAEGGRQRVRRTLHTLRGASLSLGMDQLGECSLAVESWVDRQPAAVVLEGNSLDALRAMLSQGLVYLEKLRAGQEEPGLLGWLDLIPKAEPLPPASPPEEAPVEVQSVADEETPPPATAPAEGHVDAAEPSPEAPAPRVDPAILPPEEWERLVAESEARRPPSPKRSAPAEEAPARREQVLLQVDAKSLRGLLDITGELIIDRNRFDRNLEQLREFRKALAENRDRLLDTISSFQKEFEYTSSRARRAGRLGLPNGNGNGAGHPADGLFTGLTPRDAAGSRATEEFSELEFDRYDQFNVLTRILQELVNDINEIGTGMERVTDTLTHENVEFAKMSRLLQDELASLNMLNFTGLFRRVQRVFRDALQADGKQGVLKFEGEETRLDRVILDKLYAPLMHLVRNTVAHGLEPAEDRLAAGKPEIGSVVLKAHQLSHQVIIEITDDGRGIDPGRIRAKAIERGLIQETHGPLSWEDVLDMLFTPGFSTMDEVTTLAGRGVGLDVVKRDVEEMNGSLRLVSEPGKFCRWIIQLPLTLSAADAALIQVGGQVFALPLSYVDGGVHMRPEDVIEQDGHTFYKRGEELIPLSQLGPLLGLTRPVPHLQQAVIINTGGFRAAIGIERLIGREQIVIKSLGPFLEGHPLYSGATLDAEGRVMLILNAPYLAAIVRSGQSVVAADTPSKSVEKAEEARSLQVLVVDDSLSVRKSLEKQLRQLDCDVTPATDGVDALEKMRNALFDVIFTDLEMPNMDGFQLLVEARGLEIWSQVPIYVVTSRAVDKYTQKAKSLGATGFLAKPVGVEQLRQVLAEVRSEALGILVSARA